MQKTGIEYLTHTWNPIAMRCTRVSPGCDNCWHLTTADRLCNNLALPENERLALAGKGPFVLRDRELSAPCKLKKPSVIGVQFMGDLFHEDVPFQFIWDAKRIIAQCPQHTFLVLTKRPQRMVKFCEWVEQEAKEGAPKAEIATFWTRYSFPDNWWSGLTVCNQQEADEKIMHLMDVPGKKFLSLEPLLGPIDLTNIDPLPRIDHSDVMLSFDCLTGNMKGPDDMLDSKIDAVILGGETGPGARPLHPDWVRSVRDQCAAAGVDFFFKGWGEWWQPPSGKTDSLRDFKNKNYNHETGTFKIGRNIAGRILDGRTHDDLPWVKV